ncbi:MAG: HD domain-containing protein [Candidatus Moraniibacteriota bacterium]|jgi:uncharacterized protein
MISKNQIEEIEQEAEKYFEDVSVCHDWTHVERVKKLAISIGEEEDADLQIIEIAALLHDIGRKEEFACKGKKENGIKFCHAIEGAKEAGKLLSDFDIDEKSINNIVHCISSHRFRNEEAPETLEAKVLFDADKLDSIGAVGIARDFVFVGHFGTLMYTGNEKEQIKSGKNYDFTKEDTAVLEYHKKLKYIKDRMQTKTGKKFAQERHDFMVDFFERFWDEINGKK